VQFLKMSEHAKNEPLWTLGSLNRRNVQLDPCPFCGSRQLRLYEYAYAKLFAVDCAGCGAQRVHLVSFHNGSSMATVHIGLSDGGAPLPMLSTPTSAVGPFASGKLCGSATQPIFRGRSRV
jgi:hypothetical protein